MAENQEQEKNDQNISDESESNESLKKRLAEINDKYARLYAEFENYKKFVARNKDELLKYANESLLKDLLTVVDHLELALQHSYDNKNLNSLSEGVELTLKELKTVLEKYGLVSIDALGKPFDPLIHHAITQVESIEANENTVVNELRKGYKYKDRVIRATLVGVAKKPSPQDDDGADGSKDQAVATDEK